MTEINFKKITYWVISITVFFEVGYLLWEHFNGGIVSHHLLQNSDYPAISNLWGLLILPSLALLAMFSIKKRLTFKASDELVKAKIPSGILIGFFGMLALSFLQSVAFTIGYGNISIYLALGLIIVGLFVPIYKAECIFGYVFGSIVFTGPVIPLIGILVISSISWFSDKGIKPLISKIKKPLAQ